MISRLLPMKSRYGTKSSAAGTVIRTLSNSAVTTLVRVVRADEQADVHFVAQVELHVARAGERLAVPGHAHRVLVPLALELHDVGAGDRRHDLRRHLASCPPHLQRSEPVAVDARCRRTANRAPDSCRTITPILRCGTFPSPTNWPGH